MFRLELLTLLSTCRSVRLSVSQDVKWVEEKQALYQRNHELVEKVKHFDFCVFDAELTDTKHMLDPSV